MSRSLRVARLPSLQPLVRFSGYLTAPGLTDQQVADALAPFLLDVRLWRSATQLPADWLARDDSVLRSPAPGVTPIWGQGSDVSASTVIGDPETPWRLIVGDGQLTVENVWLYDPQADPWPPASDCLPRYPPSPVGVSGPVAATSQSTGVVGAAVAVSALAAGAAALWWRGRRRSAAR